MTTCCENKLFSLASAINYLLFTATNFGGHTDYVFLLFLLLLFVCLYVCCVENDSVFSAVMSPAPTLSVFTLLLSLVVSPESLALSHHLAASCVKHFFGKGFKLKLGFSSVVKLAFGTKNLLLPPEFQAVANCFLCLEIRDLAGAEYIYTINTFNWMVCLLALIKALTPVYASLLHDSEPHTLEEDYILIFYKYTVHMEKELDQDTKLSFIWNLFAAEANAKKEASALMCWKLNSRKS
ncbi:hypothetical protein DSO57_1018171 [Entomophthora muscae]|uniref:Uncharacterized protein n=1 Tax=Entomophthora muscae TaxID=34485 RepID=A0ACC2UDX1_9FUNG|nr:hypothetical protein DSO57_1018171 [Entomophthora muscae]